MSKRIYEDDDGRTIADMSGFAARTPLGYRRSSGDRQQAKTEAEALDKPERPWERSGVSRETRNGVIWGALSAALLIALAFIAGLGIVIWLLDAFWF